MEQLVIRGTLVHGHCGDCEAPIRFGNVMLCDECALARVERLEATR